MLDEYIARLRKGVVNSKLMGVAKDMREGWDVAGEWCLEAWRLFLEGKEIIEEEEEVVMEEEEGEKGEVGGEEENGAMKDTTKDAVAIEATVTSASAPTDSIAVSDPAPTPTPAPVPAPTPVPVSASTDDAGDDEFDFNDDW